MCNLSFIKNLYFITLITLITPTTLTTNTTLTNLITPTSPTQNNNLQKICQEHQFSKSATKKRSIMTRCKTAIKICQKMSSNTICKKIVRSRQFEIQSQVASCPLRQFAKFTNKVVQDNNLYNLQKKSWPELQFANFTNKLSGMSICVMCQRIARSKNLQGLVKNNSLQKPSPGTAIRKQVVRNNNLYNLQNKSSP